MPLRTTPSSLLPVLQAADNMRETSGQGGLFGWLDGVGLSAAPTLAPAAALREHLLTDRLLTPP